MGVSISDLWGSGIMKRFIFFVSVEFFHIDCALSGEKKRYLTNRKKCALCLIPDT